MTCTCDQRRWPPTLSIVAGLDDLPRQLARFWDLREEMLARAGEEPALAAWSGRAVDDYGVMLLELWAYVGELLSIYDKAIADESYVRTAKLRPSLRRLVASLGYVPRPAVAATAELALYADGVVPVTAPIGTAFRSGAFGAEKPQVFELVAPATIDPALNQWPIASPAVATLTGAVSQLALDPTTVRLAAGDTILIDLGGTRQVRTAQALVRTVDDAGRRIAQLSLDRPIDCGAGVAVSSISIRRATQRAALKSPSGVGGDTPSYFWFFGFLFVLDGVYRGVHNHEQILVEKDGEQRWMTLTGRGEQTMTIAAASSTPAGNSIAIQNAGGTTTGHVTVPAQPIAAVTASFTVLGSTDNLDDPARKASPASPDWLPPSGLPDPTDFTIHFALVDAGRVLAPLARTIAPGDPLVARTTRAPVNRTAATDRVILRDREAYAVELGGTIDLASGVITADGGTAWSPPLATPVTGLGNIVTAVRGQTVASEVLGSGDPAQASQSFALAKQPLTYVAAPGTDAGVASTLRVWVDGLLWTEVATLYGQAPTAQVYAVRQDDAGGSHVIFGDGKRGARLTSGSGNVIASYRFGAGAASPPAGSITQLARPVPGVKRVVGPLAAIGGADAEPASSLATLAPRSALLLGRAISIDDLEVAAQTAPGVTVARADWAWDGVAQRPVVKVWIVGGDNVQPKLLADVGARLRGLAEPSTPIRVAYATEVSAALAIDLALDPRNATDVVGAARTALTGDAGWLQPAQLGIDRPLFRSVLIEQLRSIAGVTGVRGLTWNGRAFEGYGKSPGQGAVLALVPRLQVTGS